MNTLNDSFLHEGGYESAGMNVNGVFTGVYYGRRCKGLKGVNTDTNYRRGKDGGGGKAAGAFIHRLSQPRRR
jgi:hypothetical protein